MPNQKALRGGLLFALALLPALAFVAQSWAGPDGKTAIRYRPTLLVQMRVADLDRAVRFYQDVLGFEMRLRSDTLQWAELTFGIPGVAVGLGAGTEVKGSGSVSLNLGVEDIDAARSTLEARGVVFAGPTVTVPDKVKLADFSDPDGNRIRLAQSLAGTHD